jgi:hypothetical protein
MGNGGYIECQIIVGRIVTHVHTGRSFPAPVARVVRAVLSMEIVNWPVAVEIKGMKLVKPVS